MRISFAVAAMMLVAGSAFAQPSSLGAPPADSDIHMPLPERARGIDTKLASEAALTAIAVCLKNGYKVTALIVDAESMPIVLMSGNGAPAITQFVANGKVQSVMKYRMSSGEVAAKAASDPAFKTEVTSNPLIVAPRQGAIPILVGGDLVGAFAVSGAPGGDKDEVCAKAGLAKIKARLK